MWTPECREALCRFYSGFESRETRKKLLDVFRKSNGNLYAIVLGILPVLDAEDREGIRQMVSANKMREKK